MQRAFLSLCLLLACGGVVSAQAPKGPAGWPEKLFGPPANLFHDFGTVPHGTNLFHDFVLTNVYSVPIEISTIKPPTCGWGAPSATAFRGTIPPKEKTTIQVMINGSYTANGARTISVPVTFGPKYTGTVRLRLKATYRTDMNMSPGFLSFKPEPAGKAASVSTKLEYVGPLDVRVSEVVVPKGVPFTATVKQLHRNREGAAYEVQVKLNKDAKPGVFHETIHIKTDHPELGLVPVAVMGRIEK